MVLTIVLIVFIVTLGGMGLLVYLWWKKYGKKIFNMINNLSNFDKTIQKGTKLPNLNQFQKEMMKIQEILEKNGKKLKK
jgi:predicted PurR-regulated permease PerM